MGRGEPRIVVAGDACPELHPVTLDVRLNLQRKAGCRPYKAISAAAVGMQPIARPLLEIPFGHA